MKGGNETPPDRHVAHGHAIPASAQLPGNKSGFLLLLLLFETTAKAQ